MRVGGGVGGGRGVEWIGVVVSVALALDMYGVTSCVDMAVEV